MRKVFNRNRSRFEIVAEILKIMRVPTSRAHIMIQCNMSSAQSGQYLGFMESSELVRTDTVAGRVMYQKTDFGREFLGLYSKIIRLLDPSTSAACLI